MSVLQIGDTETDKLFLEYVLPGLDVQVIQNSKLYGRFGTDSDSFVGKYAIFKNLTGSPKSFRPSSTSTLPTAKQGVYEEFTLYMKRGMYGQLQFDGLALACGKGEGAVMDLVKAELKGAEIQLANKMNRQLWGDGSGRLSRVYGAVSNSVTVYVDGPSFGQDSNKRTNPANYLDEKMDVDIYSSAGVLEAEEAEISSITDNGDGTATLTMSAAVTCSDNALIFDTDTYASTAAAGTGVPMGLAGIISQSNPYIGITSGYFQGVDRSSKAWAKSRTVSCSSAAISNDKMLELIMDIEKFGRVSVGITNDVIWRAYAKILETDRTLPSEKALWGGLTGIKFYGGKAQEIPIIYDTDCPDNTLYMFDDSYLTIYSPVKNGLTWIPGDNGILTRVAGKDEWVASMVWYYNFGTTKPQAMGCLSSIKHAAA